MRDVWEIHYSKIYRDSENQLAEKKVFFFKEILMTARGDDNVVMQEECLFLEIGLLLEISISMAVNTVKMQQQDRGLQRDPHPTRSEKSRSLKNYSCLRWQ